MMLPRGPGFFPGRIARQMLGLFGYRFIADELPARGISAGENKAALGLTAAHLVHVRHRYRAGPDLVDRHHRAPTAKGKLCLRAINGVYSNRIAVYSMNAGRVVSALRNALGVDRHVDREGTKSQCNQRFTRYPSCCLCR